MKEQIEVKMIGKEKMQGLEMGFGTTTTFSFKLSSDPELSVELLEVN